MHPHHPRPAIDGEDGGGDAERNELLSQLKPVQPVTWPSAMRCHDKNFNV